MSYIKKIIRRKIKLNNHKSKNYFKNRPRVRIGVNSDEGFDSSTLRLVVTVIVKKIK